MMMSCMFCELRLQEVEQWVLKVVGDGDRCMAFDTCVVRLERTLVDVGACCAKHSVGYVKLWMAYQYKVIGEAMIL